MDDGVLVGAARSLWLGGTYGGVSVSILVNGTTGMVKMDYSLEQDRTLEEPVPPNGTVAHLVFLGGSYWGWGWGRVLGPLHSL